MAQGERSLSLSLGSKGLHLTLADRATKEFLWEHLRKMREQAREQAKASRITRAASIDAISDGQAMKRSARGKMWKAIRRHDFVFWCGWRFDRTQGQGSVAPVAAGSSYHEEGNLLVSEIYK